MRGSFIFDFLAWFPIELIQQQQNPNVTVSPLLRLFKLLRMPRLAQLLDVEKCKNIVNSYYEKQLKYNISINNYKMHYPIKRALLIVQFYRVF